MITIDLLLSIVLYFTPCCFLLSAALLLTQRKQGDKSRTILAISFIIWGVFMIGNVINHYYDTPETPAENFSLMGTNITLFAFFIILLYPIEVIAPNKLNIKNLLLLLSPCIILNIILIITQPDEIKLTTFQEIIQHIGEYNVWIRLIVTACMLPLSLIIFYIPYTHTKSRVNIQWIRWFCLAILVGTWLYIIWTFTGSIYMRFLIQVYWIAFSLLTTYQELFLRIPAIQQKKDIDPIINNHKPILNSTPPSPIWIKLTKLLEEEEVWRDPDLRLTNLASMLNTNRTTLTQIIKEQGYEGFSTFINERRIKEYIQIIEQKEVESLQEVFFEVGFRSKATAFRNFKQVTQTTPSEYLQKKLLKENQVNL